MSNRIASYVAQYSLASSTAHEAKAFERLWRGTRKLQHAPIKSDGDWNSQDYLQPEVHQRFSTPGQYAQSRKLRHNATTPGSTLDWQIQASVCLKDVGCSTPYILWY